MKKIIGILISLLVIIITIIGFNTMRNKIPYDFEVVQGNGYIWVINITDWADKDCIAKIISDGKSKREFIIPGSSKAVKIDKLTNGHTYDLVITRKDFLGKLKYKSKQYKAVPSEKIKKYAILLGASVGKTWDLNNLFSRIKDTSFCVGYRGLGEFDKTPLIKSIINSPIKPDTAIIKECAAYFPRDVDQSIKKIKYWVDELQQSGINPIIATVVPITQERNIHEQTKNPIQSINQFNGSIRALGLSEGIPVLDLQKLLSTDNKEGYLNKNFATADGLHLNKDAYRKLDQYIITILN